MNHIDKRGTLSMSKYEIYKTLEDLPVVTKLWLPDAMKVRKGVIQIIHGMCERKERYKKAIDVFTKKGYICVACDLRGHGENVEFEKDLGYIGEDGANLLVEDMHAVTVYIKNNFPDLPVILIGHSMGALIARAYTKKYDEDIDMLVTLGCPSANGLRYLGVGLVELMSIFIDDHEKNRLLDRLIVGNFNKKFEKEGIPYAWLCTDRKVVEEYNKDPKCGFSFSINGYSALCKLMCQAYSKRGWALNNPTMPVIMLAGEDDPCIIDKDCFAKSVDIMKEVGYKNMVSRLYKGARHEVLNEANYLEIIDDILERAPKA